MIVAPPGQLKTTVCNTLSKFADAHIISDINLKTMPGLRSLVLAGRYRSIIFGELEKIYARNPATAQNVEAHLKQFAEEGLRHFSYEDNSTPVMPARALIIAGMTPSLYGRFSMVWRENGFLRRFLQVNYVLQNEQAIMDSIHKWQKLVFTEPILQSTNGNGLGLLPMRYNLESAESRMVIDMMKEQPASTSTILLKKIAVVLKVALPKQWKAILQDFAPALGSRGAMLEL